MTVGPTLALCRYRWATPATEADVDERVFRSDAPAVGRPLEDMKQPMRAFSVALTRWHLRRSPIDGLLGVDRSGRLLWEPGHPKEPDRG